MHNLYDYINKYRGQFKKEIMLTSLLIIPIFGVLALSSMQEGAVGSVQESRMKQIALITTLLNFIVSLVL